MIKFIRNTQVFLIVVSVGISNSSAFYEFSTIFSYVNNITNIKHHKTNIQKNLLIVY